GDAPARGPEPRRGAPDQGGAVALLQPPARSRADRRGPGVPAAPVQRIVVARSSPRRRTIGMTRSDPPSQTNHHGKARDMIVHTDYLYFHTKTEREFIRITDEVAAIVKTSGVKEGTVLVSAMHITAGVYVNDWEDGLIEDFQVWLEKLAPAGLPYRHH